MFLVSCHEDLSPSPIVYIQASHKKVDGHNEYNDILERVAHHKLVPLVVHELSEADQMIIGYHQRSLIQNVQVHFILSVMRSNTCVIYDIRFAKHHLELNLEVTLAIEHDRN
jgi:hypothetical protein